MVDTARTSWPIFQDNQNRTWTIELTADKIKQLRNDPESPIDLLAIFEPGNETLKRLATDPMPVSYTHLTLPTKA